MKLLLPSLEHTIQKVCSIVESVDTGIDLAFGEVNTIVVDFNDHLAVTRSLTTPATLYLLLAENSPNQKSITFKEDTMLVLSRKKNEKITIAKGTPYETTIVIVDLRPSCVRIGIECDRSIPIVRNEIDNDIVVGDADPR